MKSSKRKRSRPSDPYLRTLEGQASGQERNRVQQSSSKKKKKLEVDSTKANEETTMKNKSPTNKMVKDSVTAKRLTDALREAKQNPLVKEALAGAKGSSFDKEPDEDLLDKSELATAATLPLDDNKDSGFDYGEEKQDSGKCDGNSKKYESLDDNETSEAEGFSCDESSEDETGKLFKENKRLTHLCSKQQEELRIKRASEKVIDKLRLQYYEENLSLKEEAKEKDRKIEMLEKETAQLQSTLRSIYEKTKRLITNKVSSSELRGSRSPSPSAWDEGPIVSPASVTPTSSNKGFRTPSSTPASCSGSGSGEKSGGKQVNKRGPPLNMKEIDAVAQKVLGHLTKEAPLLVDEQGEVDVGFDVKLNERAMSANIKDFSADVDKMTRHFTTLTWTGREILERSLNGLQNNKFKNAPPKKQATPAKVSAILGCVKASLIHAGQKEGPIMDTILKNCKSTIGSKFNSEQTKMQRRNLTIDLS